MPAEWIAAGVFEAIAQFVRCGSLWEPETAASLAVGATSGGPVAAPLGDLVARIGGRQNSKPSADATTG